MSCNLSPDGQALLRVEKLCTDLPARGGGWGRRTPIRVVDDVSFAIATRQTLGLVGESGCGKTTLARSILRLVPPTSGKVCFDGHDILSLPPAELRPLRRYMQIIFQDPVGSLNPRLSIEETIAEGMVAHRLVRSRQERRDKVADLLTRVGLSPEAMDRYPHEFSGGQRQRIGIARALAVEPRLLICDEPVSALDLSVQSQILNLLMELQEERRLSYLLIAHDLATVRQCSDRVAVMYRGRIVEYAPTDELFLRPAHPYTQALLAVATGRPAGVLNEEQNFPCASRTDGRHEKPGGPPTIFPGCPLHARCPYAQTRCRTEPPELTHRPGLAAEHSAACHFAAQAANRPFNG